MYAIGQKRAPDLITDGCEPPCGCWELNSGPLEKQPVLFFCLFVFRDKVSLYSPGCPGTHFVDQAGLEHRNPPASASLLEEKQGSTLIKPTTYPKVTSLATLAAIWKTLESGTLFFF